MQRSIWIAADKRNAQGGRRVEAGIGRARRSCNRWSAPSRYCTCPFKPPPPFTQSTTSPSSSFISPQWYAPTLPHIQFRLTICRRRQASGVAVNPACLEAFQELKLGKKTKYIIFAISKDLTEIVVEKKSTSTSYDEFVADLPEAECRWAIYDFEFEKEGAGIRNKICFISWCVLVCWLISRLPACPTLSLPFVLLHDRPSSFRRRASCGCD